MKVPLFRTLIPYSEAVSSGGEREYCTNQCHCPIEVIREAENKVPDYYSQVDEDYVTYRSMLSELKAKKH
tara:strand:+ start:546 stop:755 length:210 start_codon:yes stop_codon:yes gene_type:complete